MYLTISSVNLVKYISSLLLLLNKFFFGSINLHTPFSSLKKQCDLVLQVLLFNPKSENFVSSTPNEMGNYCVEQTYNESPNIEFHV